MSYRPVFRLLPALLGTSGWFITATGLAGLSGTAALAFNVFVPSAGIRLLAAISAPTAMAVRLAEQGGLTLAGFVRGGRHVVYSHPQRLRAY